MQEQARQRQAYGEALAREEAALRAHLDRQLKITGKTDDDKVLEPPAAKRSKLSRRLESCPGVTKVSVSDMPLEESVLSYAFTGLCLGQNHAPVTRDVGQAGSPGVVPPGEA